MFPSTKKGFASARGKALCQALEIGSDSPFADRALRDAWMHFDERLDRAVLSGGGGCRQLFKLSAEVTEELKASCLGIIEIDTLRVHYHDRTGSSQSVSLADLGEALTDLEKRRKTFRDNLPMPDDAT